MLWWSRDGGWVPVRARGERLPRDTRWHWNEKTRRRERGRSQRGKMDSDSERIRLREDLAGIIPRLNFAVNQRTNDIESHLIDRTARISSPLALRKPSREISKRGSGLSERRGPTRAPRLLDSKTRDSSPSLSEMRAHQEGHDARADSERDDCEPHTRPTARQEGLVEDELVSHELHRGCEGRSKSEELRRNRRAERKG